MSNAGTPRTRLKLLAKSEYGGVNRNDPIRFYYWPVFGALYRRRVELALDELTPGERVLEIGFGTGVTFPHRHEQFKEIHGLDLTADTDRITAIWKQHGIGVQLKLGNILEMPYPDNYFDSVLLISILEHLQPAEQAAAFAEIKRVLKPGGQVVYGVPIERGLMVFMFRVLGYNIREHHFSTEKDVSKAAGGLLQQVNLKQMHGSIPGTGAIYEVGHFKKLSTP